MKINFESKTITMQNTEKENRYNHDGKDWIEVLEEFVSAEIVTKIKITNHIDLSVDHNIHIFEFKVKED